MVVREKYSLRWRLKGAFRALSISLTVSLFGVVVDLIAFLATGSIILVTDLLHWVVDTLLEAVLLVVVFLASRLSRRFPWSLVVIEALAVSLGTLAILLVYGYYFMNYLVFVSEKASVSYSGYSASLATVFGGVLTFYLYRIQKKNFERYRIELLKFDTTHALIDFIAAVIATVGIVLTTLTGSYTLELVFTLILLLFVVHSLFEVVRDNLKTVLGVNRDLKLEKEVWSALRYVETPKTRVKDLSARRFGSLSVVEVHLEVEPNITVLELHRIRKRIINIVRDISDVIYHVDVTFYPSSMRRKTKKSVKRK
ncbi:MAG: cation transporter [Sulfolobales archaeon]